MKKIQYLLFLLFAIACNNNIETLEPSLYRVVLEVKDNEKLPFIMRVLDKQNAEIYNAEEVIKVDEINYRNDSIFIEAPVFEGYIAAKLDEKGFEGIFAIESYDRIVPLSATKDSLRFQRSKEPTESIDGVWQVTFSPKGPEPTTLSKGIFTQRGNKITGTFLKKTGDYRYLEGVMDGQKFRLSTFDGAHAFLFKGSIEGDKMKGVFYSGNHWKEAFIGVRNPNYELPITIDNEFLKEGYEDFNFSFPDDKGNMISLSDDRFKNKVTIVQLMGSWCPNCLDESKFLSDYTSTKPNIKILALAFEISRTPELAFKRINRLRDKIGIPYPILLAQYGSDSKLEANNKLPMLKQVLAFPTTLFIDKKGKIRKIHSGFSGPATGQKYLELTKEFDNFVTLLENE